MIVVNIMSFTWSGLGPVILWDGVLLSPEGKGGGGEGGASPPRDVLWLGARSEGRGSKGKDAVEGGGPCNVRATYVPATGRLKKKKKVMESEKHRQKNRNIPNSENKNRLLFFFFYSKIHGTNTLFFKLTFDELYHLLMGHGGHQRAVHLRCKDRGKRGSSATLKTGRNQ